MNPNWAIAAGLALAAGAIFFALRRAQDVVVAILRTDAPRIETRPGRDFDLLLDAYLAYHGADALDRLLEAIDQHGKESS
ncbi:LPXTG cell wall anchor domain-containing protein [Streptomyces sp. NPDC056390]|uniref:LPXTG cell wall anchor domain-containing protein n=1 Tax=Streptomyces sp. NPDC056390 TaxID=3345806 RepID=UPI0035E145D2